MRRALTLRAVGWGGRWGPLQGLCVWFMCVCVCVCVEGGSCWRFHPPRQSRPLLPDGSLLSSAMCLVCVCVFMDRDRYKDRESERDFVCMRCRQRMLLMCVCVCVCVCVCACACMHMGICVKNVRLYGHTHLHVASLGWLCMMLLKATLCGLPCCLYLVQNALEYIMQDRWTKREIDRRREGVDWEMDWQTDKGEGK